MSSLAIASPEYVGWQDTAVSDDSQWASSVFNEPRRPWESRLASSRSLDRGEELIRALAAAETPVEEATFCNALRFAYSLPEHWPTPEIVVEDNGHIAFDWVLAPRRVLTLAVGPDGTAGYSALIGFEPSYGRVLIGGRIPPTAEYFMKRLEDGTAR